MAQWTPFPQAGAFNHDTTSVKKLWKQLHAGDLEPLPSSPAVLAAWVDFHNGRFAEAREKGLAAAAAGESSGLTPANKATCIYANYLEPREANRLELFLAVARLAEQQTRDEPALFNAWYLQAYALGRYSQGISVAKALAQGLGSKVKESLEKTLALCPEHVDAHISLGAFHAEVIDKVGALIGGMTYGARKEVGLRHFTEALRLRPDSAIGLMEYASALLMLDGDLRQDEAAALYARASVTSPQDAMEWLDVEMARSELAN